MLSPITFQVGKNPAIQSHVVDADRTKNKFLVAKVATLAAGVGLGAVLFHYCRNIAPVIKNIVVEAEEICTAIPLNPGILEKAYIWGQDHMPNMSSWNIEVLKQKVENFQIELTASAVKVKDLPDAAKNTLIAVASFFAIAIPAFILNRRSVSVEDLINDDGLEQVQLPPNEQTDALQERSPSVSPSPRHNSPRLEDCETPNPFAALAQEEKEPIRVPTSVFAPVDLHEMMHLEQKGEE